MWGRLRSAARLERLLGRVGRVQAVAQRQQRLAQPRLALQQAPKQQPRDLSRPFVRAARRRRLLVLCITSMDQHIKRGQADTFSHIAGALRQHIKHGQADMRGQTI